jgi:hypothetical protein
MTKFAIYLGVALICCVLITVEVRSENSIKVNIDFSF